MRQDQSLIVTIYQVLWLVVVVTAIIIACSWADSGSRASTLNTIPSWIDQP
jgi:hypothetical protein